MRSPRGRGRRPGWCALPRIRVFSLCVRLYYEVGDVGSDGGGSSKSTGDSAGVSGWAGEGGDDISESGGVVGLIGDSAAKSNGAGVEGGGSEENCGV